MAYFVGAVVQVTVTFTVNDVLTDPTTLTCKVLSPSGAQTTQSATRSSAGVYTTNVSATEQGTWFVRFEASGSAAGAVETSFDVQPSRFR